ncbi:MAG: ribosome biogenesis GTP-binding protein YihA/YsxC [Bacteroidaceae bacterium]|nr:ribosome biogenesis GTP-binding protein YihA/YsxC [Prevotellaceae bacterium]MDY5632393.1 ribosome biogenesis GTP-binding protein YihA/YsxC [Bacteroidaceae bacterium]
MLIKKAEYVISSPNVTLCPKGNLFEYAFIGRSNVGKSSLINMLTGYRNLAKTSQMPGKTILINHFLINDSWYLVDLPGYGYAKRGKKEQEKLTRMIEDYVLQREQMINLFVLVDSRHEPQKIDLEFMEWLGENEIPFSIIFTKADKLSGGKASGNVQHYLSILKKNWEELPPYFLTSSESRLGREEVLGYIEQINKQLKESLEADTEE